ncbi:fibronectin type III domain-containing protein 7-like [Thalassophryne amazonica]|uniref:fibronectin type III domain-containing protein 7-like n=1 Tax=Thalassophryne amazonica TaxID=390379 RepID=UPI0014711F17|nr:fibronectin type III domain-containing protein 7-like [Thalassophryne amazonica]
MDTMRCLVIFALLCIGSQASAIDITLFSGTSKTVYLKWNKVSGAKSYQISAALKNDPNNAVAFASYGEYIVMGTVNNLIPNTVYIFTLRALDNMQSVLDTGTLQTITAPEMMDPIQTVKPKDSKTMIVVFAERTGATEYVVRVENADGYFKETTVPSSPAEVSYLEPYTEYSFSIMAKNRGGGRTQPSLKVQGKTVLAPPQLSTSSPSNDSIIVSWPAMAHAVQYTLNIINVDSNEKQTINTTDTSETISGLKAGTLYQIYAYGWDPEGRKGEASLYVNQTTRPPAPAYFNVTIVMTVNAAELFVTWKTDPSTDGLVQYNVTSDQNLTCTSVSNSCTLSPVTCGKVYNIYVTALNDAGPSYPAGPEIFTTFPCPPESLSFEKMEEHCMLTWSPALYADNYTAFIKRADGSEETCNTTGTNCTFTCECGYTYLMSVSAHNKAGCSPPGKTLNYTTLPCCPEDVSVSVVSTDTLEIMWMSSRGAEVYETRATDNSEVILCNDTAPVCALSDLSCDSSYSVVVTPCNDISGCNLSCKHHTKDTVPCMPENLLVNLKNSSCATASWTANNRAANYTVTAAMGDDTHTCTTSGNSCDLCDLHCGHTYDVGVIATSAAGKSLPSYSEVMEIDPCCPVNLTVEQVTQAMSNVSWSYAKGANTFITSVTSSRGHARCQTQNSHCLMGCITCGTNYTVNMEAVSHTGRKSNCTYQGFSSSACCPSGVRLYRLANNSLQVYWRTASSSHIYRADLVGNSNYNCTSSPGQNSCDVHNVQCGGVYHVVVAPLTPDGSTVQFCPQRLYSVTCTGSSVGMVVYRGKRSVD